MFDLEQAIAQWRRQMLAGGIKSPDPLEELESHLREEMERQIKSGMTEEEAFNSAVQQMGQAGILQAEFEKTETNAAQKRKIARNSLDLAALTYLLCGTFGLLNAEMTVKTRLLGFAAISVSVLSLLGGRYASKLFPVLPHRRSRFALQVILTLASFLWMISYFYLILPNCDFTIGQLMAATLWAMTPLAIVGGVTNAMDEAVYRLKEV